MAELRDDVDLILFGHVDVLGADPEWLDAMGAVMRGDIPPTEGAVLLARCAAIADSHHLGGERLRSIRWFRPRDLAGPTWADATLPVIQRLRRGHRLVGWRPRWWWLCWCGQVADQIVEERDRVRALEDRWAQLVAREPRLQEIANHAWSRRVDVEDPQFWHLYGEIRNRLRELADLLEVLNLPCTCDAYTAALDYLLRLLERGGTQ